MYKTTHSEIIRRLYALVPYTYWKGQKSYSYIKGHLVYPEWKGKLIVWVGVTSLN